MQAQPGLKLQATRSLADVIVIDRVQKRPGISCRRLKTAIRESRSDARPCAPFCVCETVECYWIPEGMSLEKADELEKRELRRLERSDSILDLETIETISSFLSGPLVQQLSCIHLQPHRIAINRPPLMPTERSCPRPKLYS